MVQRDDVLGHSPLIFKFSAVTLGALDASAYLARPVALAGALAACMRRAADTPLRQYKLACLRRIMECGGVPTERTRHLLANVLEAYLPLPDTDVDDFERLLTLPENQEVRHTMQTWTEQQQEIGEARGEARGELNQAREDVLRVLNTFRHRTARRGSAHPSRGGRGHARRAPGVGRDRAARGTG